MAMMSWSSTSYSQPAFAAECWDDDELLPGGAKLVASAFAREDAVTVTTKNSTAVTAGSNKTVQFQTAIAPASLIGSTTTLTTLAVPAGTVLNFGSGKIVTFPTGIPFGATQVTDATVAADLAGGETATFAGTGRIIVPAGTLVGRTFVERASNVGFGVADVSTPDDEIYLTAFQVEDASINSDVTLIRHNTLIYEDKLPGWSSAASNVKAAIRAAYQCIVSAG